MKKPLLTFTKIYVCLKVNLILLIHRAVAPTGEGWLIVCCSP